MKKIIFLVLTLIVYVILGLMFGASGTDDPQQDTPQDTVERNW